MAVLDLKVSGQRDLARLAKRLNEAGDKTIRRNLTKAFSKATGPAKDAVRESALDVLPSRGGLAALVAASRITTRTSMRGTNPSVRLSGRWSGHDLRSIDRGQLRKPVFNTGVWVKQDVTPGFWTEPLKRTSRKTRREVIFAMEDVARMVTRG